VERKLHKPLRNAYLTIQMEVPIKVAVTPVDTRPAPLHIPLVGFAQGFLLRKHVRPLITDHDGENLPLGSLLEEEHPRSDRHLRKAYHQVVVTVVIYLVLELVPLQKPTNRSV